MTARDGRHILTLDGSIELTDAEHTAWRKLTTP